LGEARPRLGSVGHRFGSEEMKSRHVYLRAIIHIDMDAFYASVEQLDNPQLGERPVIVGGVCGARGVVSAASYLARRYGVHSAMPMTRAKRLCPQGVFLPVRGERYAEVSKQIRAILKDYTPLVEPLSLDEAYLDLTDSRRLFGPAAAIGKQIKDRVRDEVHLTASVGVASNKFVAKVASDLEKPDGFVVVPPGGEREFLSPLVIGRLWGVGKKGAATLKRHGLTKIGDLQSLDRRQMRKLFGMGTGDHLYDLSRGIDTSGVVAESQPKSVSREVTFPADVADLRHLTKTLLLLSEEVGRRLRRQGLYARTVHLKIRFPPYRTLTRNRTIPFPTQRDMVIYDTALLLLGRARPQPEPVRLIGVGVSGLTSSLTGVQLSIFDSPEERDEAIDQTLDSLRDRFGLEVVRRARTMEED